jgi:hypothetical protein
MMTRHVLLSTASFVCIVTSATAFVSLPFGMTTTRSAAPTDSWSAYSSASWTSSTPYNTTGYSSPDEYTNTAVMSFPYPELQQVLRQPRTATATTTQEQQFQIYCDLDGVLVDFESGIRSLFPNLPQTGVSSFHIPDLKRHTMWARVQQADSFFATLPWTVDGKRLWQAIRPHQPTILTGVPAHKSSRTEKLVWCQRELGVQVQHVDKAGMLWTHLPTLPYNNNAKNEDGVCTVITCWSDNKHYESGPNAVLIDDREFLRERWEAKGGIFVHHDGNVDATLQKLKDAGVLCSDE